MASAATKPKAKRRGGSAGGAKKSAKATVSDDTLARLPERAVTFLVAIGNIPEVRAKLLERGYNATIHQMGWLLLDQVGGRASLLPPPPAPLDEGAATRDMAVEVAQRHIETWATTNLAVAGATLKAAFPQQHALVFAGGLKAGQGSAAVLATQNFLKRLGQLGTKRRGGHPDDAKALALLGDRGITEAERKRVHELVVLVQEGKTPATPVAQVEKPAAAREAQVKLYEWYSEWTGIARAVIKRRDYLVRIGLATLRRRKAAKPT